MGRQIVMAGVGQKNPDGVLNDNVDRLTKIDAAQRQLDGAIRMFLSSEDDLVIHTVAAVAYRVLRDLKQKKGRTELTDMISGAVFNIARKIVNGELPSLPSGIPASGEIGRMVLSLIEAIKAGQIREANQVVINVRDEKGHWNDYNKVANFMKHADIDHGAVWDVALISNVRLLEDATRCYAEVTGTVTPEIIAFLVWLDPNKEMLSPILGDKSKALSFLDLSQRREHCLDILSELKERQLIRITKTNLEGSV